MTLQRCSDDLIDDVAFCLFSKWKDYIKQHFGVKSFSQFKRFLHETYLRGGIYPIFFVLALHGQLVGFISIDAKDHKDYPSISPWLNHIYVVEEFRGKGYSRLLISHAFEYLKKNHFDEIHLCCEKHVLDFYQKTGWHVVEETDDDMYIMKYICQ